MATEEKNLIAEMKEAGFHLSSLFATRVKPGRKGAPEVLRMGVWQVTDISYGDDTAKVTALNISSSDSLTTWLRRDGSISSPKLNGKYLNDVQSGLSSSAIIYAPIIDEKASEELTDLFIEAVNMKNRIIDEVFG